MKYYSRHRDRHRHRRNHRIRVRRYSNRLEPDRARGAEGRACRGQSRHAHIGHDACRDVRCDQCGARPLHALPRDGACSAWRIGGGGRGRGGAADPGPALSQPESDDRGGIRGNRVKTIPDGSAKSDGIALGEQVATQVQADRAADGTSVPDTYRPLTSPGVWVPTTPPLFAQYARAKPWVLKSADQFRPGPPPQLSSALYARDYNETKGLGGDQEHSANARADRGGEVLGHSQSRPSMASGSAPTFGGERTFPRRECTPVRAAQHGHSQHVHQRLGCEIHLQLLASGHRHSQRRHGRQRRYRARPRLDAVGNDTDASRIPIAGEHHLRCGDRYFGIGVWAQTGNPRHRDRSRRPEAAAAVQQHRRRWPRST